MLTPMRAAELAGVVTVAYATATNAVVEADLAGWVPLLLPIGVSGVTGYFASQITTARTLARLETQIEELAKEVRTYYARKSRE